MKKKTKKLSLNREAVRTLSRTSLAAAVGGDILGTMKCASVFCTWECSDLCSVGCFGAKL